MKAGDGVLAHTLTRQPPTMDLEEARAALADAKKHGTVAWEKIKADLGLGPR